ncbi:SgcJ/EcaC family oxidoreductase [Actinokineospora auranticolor]|uniref:Uncharacterized protein (TIGR02246 family) n=1 Tax=Actinokineospora auranticolor TaxID=155976 RepID=A0A2S6GN21_9PSEU|nr:SgcJ/EcaC family oxidoreductase [Actinokineospora auranticolor]PPK66625.1 uncharacterized protein (TIGR02246 family) [Actinokineospora auranticolor]
MGTAQDIVAGLQRSWNDGDADGWAAAFAEEAEFVDVLGRVQRGRAVIADEHRKVFTSIYRGSQVDLRLHWARPLAEGLHLVRTSSTLRVPDGPRAGETRSVQTMLLRDGEILAFHNTISTTMAAFADHDETLDAQDPLGWQD